MNASRSRRGQAAMEYLMTYGWAILVVLAVLGILFLLVPLQPAERCVVPSPFQCQQERNIVNLQGNLTLYITNTGYVSYRIVSTTCGPTTYTYPTAVVLSPGNDASVYFNCASAPTFNPSATVGKDVFDMKNNLTIRYTLTTDATLRTLPVEVGVRYQ